MKRKFLVLVLGMIMIIGIFSGTCLATSKNSMTEEKVQNIVDETIILFLPTFREITEKKKLFSKIVFC